MPYKEKKRLIDLGHTHFQTACKLHPDSVTFFYRHAVLYKEIENKTWLAVPLFEQAIVNWECKDAETQKKQHQQYPKYIKAMYHLASCLLKNDMPGRSFELIDKVINLAEILSRHTAQAGRRQSFAAPVLATRPTRHCFGSRSHYISLTVIRRLWN